MKKIKIHGKLGRIIGKTWKIHALSIREALDGIRANQPEFDSILFEQSQKGIFYAIKDGSTNKLLEKEQINLKNEKDQKVHLVPIPQGGAALAMGFVQGAAMSFFSEFLLGTLAPDAPKKGKKIETHSYFVNGAENTEMQGGVVPLAYGRLKVGSKVISVSAANHDFDYKEGEIIWPVKKDGELSVQMGKKGERSSASVTKGRNLGGTTVLGLRDDNRTTNVSVGKKSNIKPGEFSTKAPGISDSAPEDFDFANSPIETPDISLTEVDAASITDSRGVPIDFSLAPEEQAELAVLNGENTASNFIERIEALLYDADTGAGLSLKSRDGSTTPASTTYPSPVGSRQNVATADRCFALITKLINNIGNYAGFGWAGSLSVIPQNPALYMIFTPDDATAVQGRARWDAMKVSLRGVANPDAATLGAYADAGFYGSLNMDYAYTLDSPEDKKQKADPGPGTNISIATETSKVLFAPLSSGDSIGPKTSFGDDLNLITLALIYAKESRRNLLSAKSGEGGALAESGLTPDSDVLLDGYNEAKSPQSNASSKYDNIKKVIISNNVAADGVLPGGGKWNPDKNRYGKDESCGMIKIKGPKGDKEESIILDNKGKPIKIGQSEFYGGAGFHKLESIQMYKTVDLICEGPIEGLVDKNGVMHKYRNKKRGDIEGSTAFRLGVHSDDANKNNVASTDCFKGVYLNGAPVKETNSNRYNVTHFDFDLAYSGPVTSVQGFSIPQDDDVILYGSQDQGMLKQYSMAGSSYRNVSRVITKDASLYGPNNRDYDFERINIKSMDYSVVHTVNNPLVTRVVFSFEIPKLFYVFEGQKEAIKMNLTPVIAGLLAALLAYFLYMYLVDSMPRPPIIKGFTDKKGKWHKPKTGANWTHIHDDVQSDMVPYEQARKAQAMKKMIGATIAFIIGGLVAYMAWDKEWDWLTIEVGEKIENSGELWPLGLQWMIESGLGGRRDYLAGISVAGVATNPYRKDVEIAVDRLQDGRTEAWHANIARITPYDNAIQEGEAAARRNRELILRTITEISDIKLNYPNSVVIGTRVSGREFSSPPKRTYDMKLKKVAIPNNYNPETRRVDGAWNGLFLGQIELNEPIAQKDLKWTDNPAWCVYDLLQNERFGLGKFGVKREDIDKWNLYAIAAHCDEFVNTGFSSRYPLMEFKVSAGNILITTALSENDFQATFGDGGKWSSEKGGSTPPLINNTIGRKIAVIYSNGKKDLYTVLKSDPKEKTITISDKEMLLADTTGLCAIEYDYPLLEPRFTFNAYIDQAQDAYKLIQQFARIFNAITYWGSGAILFSQDKQKNPVMIFTNANVTNDEGFVYSSKKKSEKFTTCKIKYVDKFDDFKPAVEYYEDLSAMKKYGRIEAEIDGFGITSKGQAHRAARYLIANGQLETELIYFKTKLEGSYLRPGDIFNVIDSLKTNHRYGGNVKDYFSSAAIGDKSASGVITLDFPLESKVVHDDKKTFLRMLVFAPNDNNTIQELDKKVSDGAKVGLGEIDKLRHSQVGEYVIISSTPGDFSGSLKGMDSDPANVLVKELPVKFQLGDFTDVEMKSDAKNSGREIWNSGDLAAEDIMWDAIALCANGKRIRIGERKMIGRNGKVQACPDDMPVDGYAYKTISMQMPKRGYVWVVENLWEGTEINYQQYRTVAASEENDGVYKISGIRYIDSKYGYLEDDLKLEKTYNGPPIEVNSPSPPSNVICSIIENGQVLSVRWDGSDSASYYKVKIKNKGNVVNTVEVKDTGEKEQGVDIDIAEYLNPGEMGSFSTVIYSVS